METTKDTDSVRIQSISYIGNRSTNKHKNNVRLYVQPYFDSSDILTVVDLQKKIKYSKVEVTNISCGHYTYQRITSSMFGKHTGEKCMLIPLEKTRSAISTKKLTAYLLKSNTNPTKTNILMVILDKRFYNLMVHN